MNASQIEWIALDVDGTLTQHRTPLGPENAGVLRALAQRYHLLIVGAGSCARIHRQLCGFPMDVIGNYGMEWARYDANTRSLRMEGREVIPVADRAGVEAAAARLRQRYGYTDYAGNNMEYHDSGMLTFPLLGTAARIEDKLAFDPDRSRRAALYADVCEAFPAYTVFIGGSSSFDIVPRPFDKRYALERLCERAGLTRSQVLFMGDDYGRGGNDEQVYRSDFAFLPVDDYRNFGRVAAQLLI